MTVAMIVAVARNGVIGRGNALPWHLPADLKRFKDLTMGHCLIMGRRTYESIGRPLPGRRSIVLSRRGREAQAQDCVFARNLEEALRHAGSGKAFVIGGAQVFAEAFPFVKEVHLTRLHCDFDGDVFLPGLDLKEFMLHRAEEFAVADTMSYGFYQYHRRGSAREADCRAPVAGK